tara:strand:- start:234 stop:425 length:192 start_codon:yes stop_codon:yes gene_type:complete
MRARIMDEFNGWGCSTVATKYIYQRLQDILNLKSDEDVDYHLSRLSDELARVYFGDTNKKIGE